MNNARFFEQLCKYIIVVPVSGLYNFKFVNIKLDS